MIQIKTILLASISIFFLTACGGSSSNQGSTDTDVTIVQFVDLEPIDINAYYTDYSEDADGNRLAKTLNTYETLYTIDDEGTKNLKTYYLTYTGSYTYDFNNNTATEIWEKASTDDSYLLSGTSIYIFDEEGIVQTKTIEDSNYVTGITTYSYDELNNIDTISFSSDDGISRLTTYNNNQQILSYEYINSDGTSSRGENTYRDNGSLETNINTNIHIDDSWAKRESTYDITGTLLLTSIDTFSSGQVTETLYTYHSNGKVQTSSAMTTKLNGYWDITNNTYNIEGKLIEYSIKDSNGAIIEGTWTYHTNGSVHQIDSIRTMPNGYWVRNIYTYDENGNLIDATTESGYL